NYQKAVNELDGLSVLRAHLSVLESQIAIARAGVGAAEADVDASVIRAPQDGRVLERIVEVGGAARVGEPMISLWIGRPWVEAWVDERDLRKFRIGSPADISLDASGKGKLSGKVESIGLVTDKQLQPSLVPATLHALIRQNAMVPVRIALDGDNPGVQLGLSAVVGIQKESVSSDANAPALLGRVSP
ncbi:MAG TPA: HlyD family efflux transporter periplasmic adaptor subunit, partial [Terriglobales bacterium]|nr:HlyD family efflux transporter periplasmic adaptor subunit [Terriglobales bacterium]